MSRLSTREAAKKLSYETLARYIAVGKVAAPEIANGRKTRYKKTAISS